MKHGAAEVSGKVIRNGGFAGGVVAGAVLTCLIMGAFALGQADARQEREVSVETLMSTSQTIVGEPLVYPVNAPARVTAAIVTLPEGLSTGWHSHGVPLFAYLLEGELTIDYGAHGTRIYRAGDAFMEAKDVAHNGHNSGGGDARILAVYMAAEGLMLSHDAEPEGAAR